MGLFSSMFGGIGGLAGDIGSLGGSMSSGKSSSTTQASGDSTTTLFDETSKSQLDQLVASMMGKVGGIGDTSTANPYSKSSALKDVSGVVDNLFKTFREQNLPQIMAAGGQAGVYNSSGMQAMADNAYAQTVGQAASITMDAVKSYAGIDNTNNQLTLQSLLQGLNMEGQALQKTSQNSTSTTNTKASNKSLNFGLKL